MKITFVTGMYLPRVGGLELVIYNLAHRLAGKGHLVNVIAPRYQLSTKSKEEYNGINVKRIYFDYLKPKTGFNLLIFIFRCIVNAVLFPYGIYKTWRLIRRDRPEIVNLYYASINSAVSYCILLLACFYKFKLVLNLQTPFIYNARSKEKVKNRIFRKILNKADYLITCSQSILTNTIKNVQIPNIINKAAVIHNGIDLNEFQLKGSYKHKRPYVLSVANLYPCKGLDILISAFQDVAQKQYNLDLIIVGHDYLNTMKGYKSFARLLKLEDRIIFLQNVQVRTEIVKLYNGCEFFVLPSRAEPFGMVNLEAMAAGKAIVATNTGGIPEVVKDGVNGILVDPLNDRALGLAILKLSQDYQLRQRLAENGKKIVKQYQWDNLVDKYLDIYKKVLKA